MQVRSQTLMTSLAALTVFGCLSVGTPAHADTILFISDNSDNIG
jgi:hypothetical protein